jgi:hypothetical protein
MLDKRKKKISALPLKLAGSQALAQEKRVHWLTEDMIMKLLPPGNEKRMSY